MDAITRERTLIVLKKAQSLDDAEKRLVKVIPGASLAMIWGLFDGFAGRPETTSGLVSDNLAETAAAKKITREYRYACTLGRELATCELPR